MAIRIFIFTSGTKRIIFTELPSLPIRGQRIEDIGLFLRKDLKVTEQLKSVLRDVRNHATVPQLFFPQLPCG